MKRSFRIIVVFLVMCLLYSESTHAQWYSRRYKVDSLQQLSADQYNQAMKRASTTRNIGIGLSLSGVAIGSVGSLIGYNAYLRQEREHPDDLFNGLYGAFLISASIVAGSIPLMFGVPTWIVGSIRMNQLFNSISTTKLTVSAIPIIIPGSAKNHFALGPTITIHIN